MISIPPRKRGPKPLTRQDIHPDLLATLSHYSLNVLAIVGGFSSPQMLAHELRCGVGITPAKIAKWTRLAQILGHRGPVFVEAIPPSADVPGVAAVTS